MKKGLNEIILIIDKSGSMCSIKDDAIGGYNEFIEKQKTGKGTANVTTILFDTDYKVVNENVDVNVVEHLNEETYHPSGMTALLDSVGKTINNVGKRLSNTSEENRPEKVIMCILTDGQENSSTKYNRGKIKEMIEHQKEKYNWEFIYLGANQDSFTEAGNIGINSIDTQNFQATGVGIRMAYKCMADTSLAYRCDG